ncbi:hypothetical protein HPB47_001221 [Ixodes persulcatus]|uniref:Uncharacterized protein n=1 Tax=Ixodes persulcatus TaxID=34615 RepID=A0AC60PR80_IXOPE|nr:hypothetical protein HPB47_001221 [Ixodes persulcatus]
MGVCAECTLPISSRQTFIACSGECDFVIHTKCLNIRQDYDVLFRDGVSIYKCTDCTRRPRGEESLVNADVLSPGSTTPTAMGSHEHPANSAATLTELLLKVDRLEATVTSLKLENAAMRLELKNNNSMVMKCLDFVNTNLAKALHALLTIQPTGPGYASVAKNTTKQTSGETPPVRPSAVNKAPANNETQRPSRQSTSASTAPSTHSDNVSPSSGKRNQPDDGWNEVRRRRKAEIRGGASKSTTLRTVPRGPARKALFVTRMNPDTTTEDIEQFVADVVKDDTLVCTRLKSKFSTYSSFHVALSGIQSLTDRRRVALRSPEGADVLHIGSRFEDLSQEPLSPTGRARQRRDFVVGDGRQSEYKFWKYYRRERAGWLHVKIGKKNEASKVKPNTRAVRRTMAATTRAARMPGILPKEENKIIVRPRGGLNLARTSVITIMAAIRSAANLTQAETMFDIQCPNVQQNIMVISTPDDLRARRYPGVKEIKIGDRTYEVSAYAAAPNGAVKGVVRGIPIEDSAATITENILTVRNPKARAAQRIVGHRADVCPTPEAKVCIGCREETDQAPQCTPKCKLCGGPHITGDRECKNKFKAPYIVRRRQWERKELSPVEDAKQEKAGKGIPPKKTAEHFPLLRAPRSRKPTRTASRSRSRSVGGKATWAQVAELANKEMKTLREANRQQAKKIAEQEETIRRMAADMAAVKEMMQKMVNKNQTAEVEEPAENAEEPPAKRKSPEAGRIRRSEERQDKSEKAIWEHMDWLEEGCRSMEGQFNAMFAKITDRLDTIASLIPKQQWQQHLKAGSSWPSLVYNSPKQSRQRFKNLFHENLRAEDSTPVVAGDFNAPHTSLGNQKISYKGRNLIQDATEADLQLIPDPRQPTLMGRKSTDSDTTPDLVFTNEEETSWANTKEDLGSDHCIVEISVPLKVKTRSPRKFTYTNWDAFRKAAPTGNITDIETWTRNLLKATTSASRKIETTEETDGKMDSRLAHLIEAKQSICNRWRKQRLNRKLRKKIAELNRAIHEHCTKLSAQQWEDTCDTADRQMHNGATWRLLRHLLDETKT